MLIVQNSRGEPVHHFNEIEGYRRLGGAQARPNNQYEVLAKPDTPPAHCWVLPKKRAQALEFYPTYTPNSLASFLINTVRSGLVNTVTDLSSQHQVSLVLDNVDFVTKHQFISLGNIQDTILAQLFDKAPEQ